MIRLIKLTNADVIHGRSIAWLARQHLAYRAARVAGEDVSRFLKKYKAARVKAAILVETYKKCAYCESKYVSVTWGDVEHISPKCYDAERLLDYENLTLACAVCNVNKGDTEYNDGHPLLHPYRDDPSEYLIAKGPWLVPVRGEKYVLRAQRTIDLLRLNRVDLLERRGELVERCDALAHEYYSARADVVKAYAIHRMRKMSQHESEYSFTAFEYFRTYCSTVTL